MEQVGCELTSVETKSGISYSNDGLVKVREDNKIEFVVKRDDSEFTAQQVEFFSKHEIEVCEASYCSTSNVIYVPLSSNGKSIDDILDELMEIPGISYSEPNFHNQMNLVPDDPHYEYDQYDMQLIGMYTAWDFGLGSSDVIVAVLDTGIDYDHPDLIDNYLFDENNLPLGYDWINDDADPDDDHGHGTHCAGTIAAVTNNGIGVAGMAQVSIIAEKVLGSDGRGSDFTFYQGVLHAVDLGADIISCSLGGPESLYTRDACDYASDHGVLMVAAAGNDMTNDPSRAYPAANPDVIAVSSTDRYDSLAWDSNYGDWIDIAAPGVNILSTLPGGHLGWASGTSMACPHVSGLAALIKSHYLNYTAWEIRDKLFENAVDLGDPGKDPIYGYGRINAYNLFGPCPEISNPSPENEAIGVSTNPTLSVDVFHPDNLLMNVSFYRGDGYLIGTQLGVVSGETASITWSGLAMGTTYDWYAIAEDGITSRISPVWYFTTNRCPYSIINISPKNGATDVHDHDILLIVDVFDSEGDSVEVSFYDASDHSLIGTIDAVYDNYLKYQTWRASLTWSGLSEGTTYNWYAIANDGIAYSTSPTWSFTTMEEFYPVANFITRIFVASEGTWDFSFLCRSGQDIKFIYTGTQGDGITSYLWDFGDGSPISNEPTPIHYYKSDGFFNITLRVQDADGDWSNEVEKQVFVLPNDEPVLSGPEEVTIIYGTTGNWIRCTVTDTINTRPMYAYYVDEFDIYHTHFYDWEPGTPINIYADKLSLGPHEFFIFFFDGYKGYDNISVLVNVIELPPIDAPLTPGLIVVMLVGVVGFSAFLSWNVKRRKAKR